MHTYMPMHTHTHTHTHTHIPHTHLAALRCLYHPFVYGIATGKLPLVSFKNYVGQDAFFLNAFASAYKRSLSPI